MRPQHTTPEWLKSAVFYEIYPQSFCDSNGDGIGDIPGIITKLDYVKSLGVGAIWLNPCFESPMRDAGYDISDYCRVAARYGTNADLKRLFRQAHKRGLRVCLDLVAGHTSIDHPWFKRSSEAKRNRYSDWYIWSDSPWQPAMLDNVSFIRGMGRRHGNYAANFFYGQPALNYGFAKPNPAFPWQQGTDASGPRAVRRELRRIMRFWMERGADGFRVDMAASLVKNDPGKKATIALWRELTGWFRHRYPEGVLISEWSDPKKALAAGFHVDFLIHIGTRLYPELFIKSKGVWQARGPCFFDTTGRGNIRSFLDEYLRQYRATSTLGYMSVPSANHDIPRPADKRSRRELEVIYAFLFTWPGVPFLYYGDEIGMRYLDQLPSHEGGYERTGSRTPMQWHRGRNAGFSTAPAGRLYLPIDPRRDRPTVEAQESDPHSLLNFVRRLIALRKATPALQSASGLRVLYARANRYPFVYMRTCGRQTILVALNPSGQSVEVSIPAHGSSLTMLMIARGAEIRASARRLHLTMQPVSYGAYSLKAGS